MSHPVVKTAGAAGTANAARPVSTYSEVGAAILVIATDVPLMPPKYVKPFVKRDRSRVSQCSSSRLMDPNPFSRDTERAGRPELVPNATDSCIHRATP